METRALIELLDRDGSVRQVVRVFAWPIRIGRAVDCDVVLDDPHVAPHHAQLDRSEDGVQVVPAATLNGVLIGRQRLAPAKPHMLERGAVITLGASALRLRLSDEVLAPELPLAVAPGRTQMRALALAALALVGALWGVLDQWLATTPGTPGLEMASMLLGTPIALGVWCGLWAMGSKLFQRHFAFWPHLEVALVWLLLGALATSLGQQLAFTFSLPALAALGQLLTLGAFAMMLWRHLSLVLPQRRRAFAWLVASLFVAGHGLDVAARQRKEQPLFGSLYLSTLSPPAMRVAKPMSVDAFVESARPLEGSLSRWARNHSDETETVEGDEE